MKKTVLGVMVTAAMAVSLLAAPNVSAVASESTGSAVVAIDRDHKKTDKDDDARFQRDDRVEKKKKKKRFRVKPGATFNAPFSAPEPIRKKMLSAIRHTGKGQKIRVMTWSFYDSKLTYALIQAHKRGASVRLIMSRNLSRQADAGKNYRWLTGALKKGNKARSRDMRSWTRTCFHACRAKGSGGHAMHDKWISFSKSGRSRQVVMEGSANLNFRAAFDQWNDWFTVVGREKIYETYQKVFSQAAKDKKAKPISIVDGKYRVWFAPRRDNLQLALLRKVRCKGTSLNGGRTEIRIAAAVMRGSYGLAIARRLRELANQGCSVLMTFTIHSPEVNAALGSIKGRHLVYDNNGDGLYDDYLHMKAMSIIGRVGRDRSAHVVYQGSANWSNPLKNSDEQGMIIRYPKPVKKYAAWLTRLYNGAPSERLGREYFERRGVVDPYANVELG